MCIKSGEARKTVRRSIFCHHMPKRIRTITALASHASCLLLLGAMAHNLTYSRDTTSSNRAVLVLCAHKTLGQEQDERSRPVACHAWRAWSAEPSHAQSSPESVPTISQQIRMSENASVSRQALLVEGHQPQAMIYVHKQESGEHP